jgi:hypothetical protein
MSRILAGLVAAALLALSGGVASAHESGAGSGAFIPEDAPGWDCATMGNRQCGPSL